MVLDNPVRADGPTVGPSVVTERLQNLFQQLMSQEKVKNAIVAVESNDGCFRWLGVAGDANPDGTPMRADTPFHIASIDKLYTASMVMMLHERGYVRLDDPISNYLPQTLISRLHRHDHCPAPARPHLRFGGLPRGSPQRRSEPDGAAVR